MRTLRSNSKQILKLKEDKKISRNKSNFHYSKNLIYSKWYDNKVVLLLATNVVDMSGVSKVMRQKRVQQPKHLFLFLTSSSFKTVELIV